MEYFWSQGELEFCLTGFNLNWTIKETLIEADQWNQRVQRHTYLAGRVGDLGCPDYRGIPVCLNQPWQREKHFRLLSNLLGVGEAREVWDRPLLQGCNWFPIRPRTEAKILRVNKTAVLKYLKVISNIYLLLKSIHCFTGSFVTLNCPSVHPRYIGETEGSY